MPTTEFPAAWSALERGRADFLASGGSVTKPLDYVRGVALQAAKQYHDGGWSAYVDFEPGNMTSYAFVLHDLHEAQVQSTIRRLNGLYAPEELTPERRAAHDRRAREKTPPGASGRFGGELLIAMPIRGASVACALMDYYHPSFVVEHLNARWPDAVPISEFLTLFGDAVLTIRDRAAQEATP